MAKKIPFSVWQERAQVHSLTVDGPDDLWAEDDPYDLREAAKSAHARGQTPEAFVEEIFADDIASRENDRLMAAEAEEYEEEEKGL